MKLSLLYFDLSTGYYPGFHHGIAYLIGQIKNAGHEIELFHLTTENELIKAGEILHHGSSDVVGFSFATNQLRYVKRFTKEFKKQTFWIAGGVHGTLVKEKLFDEIDQFDAICIGEGDTILVELLNRLSAKQDYYDCPGFAFNKTGTINQVLPPPDVEQLAFPDYTLFDYKKIIRQSGNVFPMQIGRGCPYNCSYCCNHIIKTVYPRKKDYVRWPSVSKAIDIIRQNLSIYPETQKIAFSDDTFTLNKRWLNEFCISYKENIGLPFSCNARVETIDEKVLSSLKMAGCKAIDFGVETGNEWLRKTVLNRRHSNTDIINAFRMTRKFGIKCFSFNITALPFETYKMAKETLKLNMTLRSNFGKCFFFFPYPGSSLFDTCQQFDLMDEQEDEVSGYLEKPVIKDIFMTKKEALKISSEMNLFFFMRLVTSKLRLPIFLEKLLFVGVRIFKKPILWIVQSKDKNSIPWIIKSRLRKFALLYFRL